MRPEHMPTSVRRSSLPRRPRDSSGRCTFAMGSRRTDSRNGQQRPICRENNAPPDVGTPNGAYGWGEIRTRGTLSRTHAFQACALNHSATHPERGVTSKPRPPAYPRHHVCCDSVAIHGGRLVRTGRDSNSRYRVNGMPVFETGAFNHSATCPAEPRNLVRRKSMVNARNHLFSRPTRDPARSAKWRAGGGYSSTSNRHE